MENYIHLVLVILRLIDIILHIFGIYLLIICNRKSNCRLNKNRVSTFYIVNLSITEICFSTLWLFMVPVTKIFTLPKHISAIIEQIQPYIMISIYTLVAFVFYATMFEITLDRLLAIKLSIKYRIYCTVRTAQYVLIATWVTGGLLFIAVVTSYRITGFNFDIWFHSYFYTPLNITFVILTIFTYGFLFQKYKRSSELKRKWIQGNNRNAFIVFHKSRFYLSVLIVLTFVLLIIIPDLTYLFLSLRDKQSKTLLAACVISYSLSNIVDGLLYIFCQPDIRREMKRRLSVMRGRRCHPLIEGDVSMRSAHVAVIEESRYL